MSTLGFPEDYINGFSRNSAGDITFGSKRPDGLTTELDDLKMELMRRGVRMDVLESAVPWSEFKKDDRGLVTCVVQDYRNDEVLMVAWMNEESYKKTLETGKMTYWSRSRQELWTKGLTSGHISYVRSLDIDCSRRSRRSAPPATRATEAASSRRSRGRPTSRAIRTASSRRR